MKHYVVWLMLAAAAPAVAQPAVSDTKPADDTHEFGSACAYPAAALATHTQGTTMVSFTGTRDGTVTDVKILVASGNADLDAATVQCISGWHFDAKIKTYQIGPHRTNISWTIPDAKPGEQTKPPSGVLIGIPHVCLMDYPTAAMWAGIQGTTRVGFTITDKGHVIDLHVVQSSGNADLDEAALQCIGYWHYLPARRDDKPIAVPWVASIVWKLENWQPPHMKFANPPRDCLKSYAVNRQDLANGDGVTELSYKVTYGAVSDVVVDHSSGNPKLDSAASECITTWKYEKLTTKDGRTAPWPIPQHEKINWNDAIKPAN